MRRQGLLIDAMGTLLALEDPVPRLVALLRERCDVGVDPAAARTALVAEITYYRAHMLEGRDPSGLAALHRDCATVLRDALGLGLDVEAMVGVLLDALRFVPYDDARSALVRARDAGARVIVVSNWDVSLVDVLGRAGLAELIDEVVTSAGVGAPKPRPEIFARATALAGVPAGDCLHVGDSLDDDVAGAQAAGIVPILLDRAGDARPPAGIRVIHRLDELDLIPSGR